ncbi:MAG: hypothetical protein A2252_03350 [Elusimicrobia bacterium RIFOXYA2_FULL_39_19]|nr:MAG: hypothetical protein A2252_03350 [Elusimicrobia bacterium RIFOXYA2_FULL_39_19]
MDLPTRIGIISGRGKFPVLIVENIKKYAPKTDIYAAGFKGETNKDIKKYSVDFKLFPLGTLGFAMEYFKSVNVNKVLMAGLVSHQRLFDNSIKMDEITKQMFDSIKDKRADSILGAIGNVFKNQGLELMPILPLLEGHLASEGILNSIKPEPKHQEDISFGFSLVKDLSRFDIGQTIVVKNKCVVAVEALEGTDYCILRSGKLSGTGNVIIKVAKLHQDLRFDLPVIGPRTIKVMKHIKASAIAVESGKTCIIEKERVLKMADKHRISIVGVSWEK